MRLPVIQTCGDCSRMRFDGRGEPFCFDDHRATIIDARKPPPSWCPIRTGPDAERIAALEAVASAANAWFHGPNGDRMAALDAALTRLRSVT